MNRFHQPRMTGRRFILLGCLLAGLLLAACGVAPAATPTPFAAVTALARVTASPLPSRSVTLPEPSATPRPTSPSAPTPAVGPASATPVPPATATATPSPAPPQDTPTPPPPTAGATPLPVIPSATPDPGGTAPAAGYVWQTSFFANTTLSGQPLVERVDSAINFSWGAAAPVPRLPADGFSVRWTRRVAFAAGQYIFYARNSDGVRVYINDVAIIDDWQSGRPSLHAVPIGLQSGIYDLRVEHYTAAGSAELQVWWEDATLADWTGSYYANPELAEPPALVRSDKVINFDWETFAPAASLPIDNFSVRWLDTPFFEEGLYRFAAASDDGLRIYVNGLLLLDLWRDGAVSGAATVWLPAGQQRVMVEYYERRQRADVEVGWTKLDFSIRQWRGEYFANPNLLGVPTIVRDDAAPAADWGSGAPGPDLPGDLYSIRWTRDLQFEEGIWQFSVAASGGVRIYVGDQLVLDSWEGGSADAERLNNAIVSGQQTVIVEYFDPGGPAQLSVAWERIGPAPK